MPSRSVSWTNFFLIKLSVTIIANFYAKVIARNDVVKDEIGFVKNSPQKGKLNAFFIYDFHFFHKLACVSSHTC